MKKILFITGTRADYGKIKSLIRGVEHDSALDAYIYVSGMHLYRSLGDTYCEVLKDGYKNTYVAYGLVHTDKASIDLGILIQNLTGYIEKINPDLIVVHGDRVDAMAGAIVGALNNILVAHIEGGELSGTIDESIRHSISKLSHIHLVSNESAKNRLIQMGENASSIYIIGSPDIDIMLHHSLPSIEEVKERYDFGFENYGLLMYHPVTTEVDVIGEKIKKIVDAVIKSKKQYIVVYPNNDWGYQVIINEYRRLENSEKIRIYPSIRFEYFLTILKEADFVLGNSSAGIREASIYGIPVIDVGSRQQGRYSESPQGNIKHVIEDTKEICDAIGNVSRYRKKSQIFGDGKSTEKFMDLVKGKDIWNTPIQKQFFEI